MGNKSKEWYVFPVARILFIYMLCLQNKIKNVYASTVTYYDDWQRQKYKKKFMQTEQNMIIIDEWFILPSNLSTYNL